jgi:CDP-glucose 4,6-dehydratase
MAKDYSLVMKNTLGQRLRELPGPLLLTGHTGFKGTWMTLLLEYLNVPVIGYSLPEEKGSLYDRAERIGSIPEVFADILDYDALERFIDLHRPSTVIHMAAQPLVLKSYGNPRETFDVNVMGTVNALDIAFRKDFIKTIIVVTTDKVYKNDDSVSTFVESHPLEGKDPYSASKVGTEAVVVAWQQIARVSGGPKVISVRAGNVIGGGDFAEDRIIPDLIRGVIGGAPVVIRNQNSTRPWQHVLDPLRGYLMALEESLTNFNQPNLNFGPKDKNLAVAEVAKIANKFFPNLVISLAEVQMYQNKESIHLHLDSSLSFNTLNWSPSFSQDEAINMSFDWWKKAINNEATINELCLNEIKRSLQGAE